LELAVCDQGAGISPEDLPRIFDEFVQLAHRGNTAQPTGTGLGLPISKRLSELLGGSLTAESQQGEGSTFRLRLPARAPRTSRPDPLGEGDRNGATGATGANGAGRSRQG
jgi:signal transduction histidine kinase